MSHKRDYNSLDDMVAHEGIIAVLKFLANSPTEVGGVYRHTRMKVVPFSVRTVQPQTTYLQGANLMREIPKEQMRSIVSDYSIRRGLTKQEEGEKMVDSIYRSELEEKPRRYYYSDF